MVKSGKMPQPRQLTAKRMAWDVRELDVSVNQLPPTVGVLAPDNTWDKSLLAAAKRCDLALVLVDTNDLMAEASKAGARDEST
jgi:hypothetical protein